MSAPGVDPLEAGDVVDPTLSLLARTRTAGRHDLLVVRRAGGHLFATRPARAWRHFLRRNGFLLSAGVSYQALFALSATVYVVFVMVGRWLGAQPAAVDDVIVLINSYIPGLIGAGGILTPNQVQQIADGSQDELTVTGVIAFVAAVWTAVGWVTYSRRAVRHVFGLDVDLRNYFRLKALDLLAATVFGVALIAGGVLASFGEIARSALAAAFGWHPAEGVEQAIVRVLSVLVTLVLDTGALAGLYRFLAGTRPTTRALLSGSLIGGVAMAALQVAAGILLSRTPLNPLLATFAVFIGLLLWFRLVGVVIVASAAWVAVATADEVAAPATRPRAADAAGS